MAAGRDARPGGPCQEGKSRPVRPAVSRVRRRSALPTAGPKPVPAGEAVAVRCEAGRSSGGCRPPAEGPWGSVPAAGVTVGSGGGRAASGAGAGFVTRVLLGERWRACFPRGVSAALLPRPWGLFRFYSILGPSQKQGLSCCRWLKSKCEQTLAAQVCKPRTLSRFWSTLVFGRKS